MSDSKGIHGSKTSHPPRSRIEKLEAEIFLLQEKLSNTRRELECLAPHAAQRANVGPLEEGPALRASEGQLSRLLDLAPVAILETDATGVIIYANAAAADILDLVDLQAQGRESDVLDWHLCWPTGQPLKASERPIERALKGKAVEEAEIILGRPGGIHQKMVLRLGAVPIQSANGKIEGTLVTLTDVTSRYAAAEALRASEERSRLAFEAAYACAWELDPTSGKSTWDVAAGGLLSLSEEVPFTTAIATFVHQDDVPEVEAAVASALDPTGQGRYALEHRAAPVISPSGPRWLQSLGQTHFQGFGSDRQPVRLVCVTTDVTERHLANQRHTLLVAELNHRVKNTLAVVQALAEQTRRAADKRSSGSTESRQLHASFQARLLALARAHDLLTLENWEGATLQDIIDAAIKPFGSRNEQERAEQTDREKISFEGPHIRVAPEASVALSIGIHELATNAVRHGALLLPDGEVTIAWEISLAQDCVELCWKEHGGPEISGPPPANHHGFGLRLLERGLARQLGGQIRLEFASAGLCCRMTMPLSAGRVARC